MFKMIVGLIIICGLFTSAGLSGIVDSFTSVIAAITSSITFIAGNVFKKK